MKDGKKWILWLDYPGQAAVGVILGFVVALCI